MAIKIGTVVKKYKVASTGALTPDDSETPFYRTSTSDITYTAWYPYSDEEPTKPTIVTDQSDTEAQESCNLMTASGKAVNGQTATIQFIHKAARLRFYLTDPESDNAPVTGAMVTATIGSDTYTAHEDGNGYYSLLVAPGKSVTNGKDFLTITASGKTYKATAPAKATFIAGKSYNYTFALKRPPYLTFTAASEQGFKMTKTGTAPGGKFEYSINNGEWTTVTAGTEVTFGGETGTLRLRGNASLGTGISGGHWSISFTNDAVLVAASGDIRTLVNYKEYDTVNTGNVEFRCLFKGCTALETAPELPATTLQTNCYYYMFNGCTNLKKAPELPATTLATSCYAYMFQDCTALEKAPELPATTLVTNCYGNMFSGCKNLKEVTIKATEIADGVTLEGTYGALNWWLQGVASEGTIHKKAALTLTSESISGIPSGWTAVNDVTD